MIQKIHSLKNSCKGQTLAILGGSPALIRDMELLPETDQLWGLNHHALILPLDRVVVWDVKLWKYIKDDKDKFIVSGAIFHNIPADIDKDIIAVEDAHQLSLRYTGALALYAADVMGFSKIYVAGCNQYEDPQRLHWWSGPNTVKSEKHKQLNDDPNCMSKYVRTLKNPQNVYFVSGRLKELHQ